MKFEERIEQTMGTLEEQDFAQPQVAGQPPVDGQPQVTGDPEQDSDALLDFLANNSKDDLSNKFGYDDSLKGDDKFQSAYDAFLNSRAAEQQGGEPNNQINPAAASNNQQTTSAAPVSTSPSGVTGVAGAISTEV